MRRLRAFEIIITDSAGTEVIHVSRPWRCGYCPCSLHEIEVQSPPGTVIGRVEQQWSVFKPSFLVKDEFGNPFFRISGPYFACPGSDVEFPVTSANGSEAQVGMVTKQWSGLGKELFTDADNFGVSFPRDLPVKMKATLLGALFLIDFMYFEQ